MNLRLKYPGTIVPDNFSERRKKALSCSGDAAEAGSVIPLVLSEPNLPSGRGRVFLRQYELVERVLSYQPSADEEALNRAYVFAMVKHGEQKRHSGDPYFAHPVSVAGLLTDLRLDQAAIIAGLLHDTVEDTGVALEEIEDIFGGEVARLVDGVTRIGRLSGLTREQGDAANFQKFILATAHDIRVLLVKLADRLHNMRTLDFVPDPASRRRIACDTMEIYAPLSRRIGLSVLGGELEDLSFRVLELEQHGVLQGHLGVLAARHEADVSDICTEIERVMSESGVTGEVTGRIKRPYDIWRKLEHKSVALEEIADIFAFRLIVSEAEDCYKALGVAHRHWPALPGGVKDYISVPKPNGYRSLHTSLRCPGGLRIELQIRTQQMHAVAERGVAAHWRYKSSEYGFDRESAKAEGLDVESDLMALADMLAHGADPEEFLEHAKLELYRDSVFVFTPGGRLIKLPSGAMPLDFAYALHSEIGDSCASARINGLAQPLRTPLQNGDVVEIGCHQEPKPQADWECLVVTGRARSAIRRMIRSRHREECELLGRTLLVQEWKRLGFEALDMEELAQRSGHESVAGLLVLVGEGRVSAEDLLVEAYPEGFGGERREAVSRREDTVLVAGDELTPGVSLRLAECCCPLPGDRIVGVMCGADGSKSGHVRVHVIDCGKLADEGERWINLRWRQKGEQMLTRLLVTTVNERGVLASLCRTVSDTGGNISNVAMTKRTSDFFEMQFDIEVKDARHSLRILVELRTLKPVISAERVCGGSREH